MTATLPRRGGGLQVLPSGTRVRLPAMRPSGKAEDWINAARCNCPDARTHNPRCPWHLAMVSVPRDGDPKVHGQVSEIARVLLTAYLHGVRDYRRKNAARHPRDRQDYTPGRNRGRRIIGGRNSRTKPPAGVPLHEKGSCCFSTVTDAHAELARLRIEGDPRTPLVETVRRRNTKALVVVHPRLVDALQGAVVRVYRIRLSTDPGGFDDPDPAGSGSDEGRSSSGESVVRVGRADDGFFPDGSLDGEGRFKRKSQREVGTSNPWDAGTQEEAVVRAVCCPWWRSLVNACGGVELHAARKVLEVCRTLARDHRRGADVLPGHLWVAMLSVNGDKARSIVGVLIACARRHATPNAGQADAADSTRYDWSRVLPAQAALRAGETLSPELKDAWGHVGAVLTRAASQERASLTRRRPQEGRAD